MMQLGKAVVIGAGNMATRLSLALQSRGLNIVQVYSRTARSASLLAERLGNIPFTTQIGEIQPDAQIYIFSVSDSALPHIISQLPANDALWLHTAGSMPIEVFCSKTDRCGVLYPMQTISRDRDIDWSEVPVFIESRHPFDLDIIERIASSISNRVIRCTSQQRRTVHLAAVFACNFSNHMYAIAEHLLNKEGLDCDVMKLLTRATEKKAEQMSPRDGQTGPAVRNDKNVMDKHMELLEGTPECELYRAISQNIDRYKNLID